MIPDTKNEAPDSSELEALLTRALLLTPRETLADLLAASCVARHSTGTSLLDEGGLQSSLFLVVRGALIATEHGRSVSEESVTSEVAGALFGLAPLLGRPWEISFYADGDLWLLSWTIPALEPLFIRWPGLREQLEVRLSLFKRRESIATLLARSPRFRGVGATLMRRVVERAALVPYPAGTKVFDEGDEAQALYIIVSGEVTFRKREGMEERALSTVHVGECFGEIAVINGAPRSASAIAQTDTVLLVLGKRSFAALSRNFPTFRSAIHAISSERIEADRRGAALPSLVWIVSDTALPAAKVATYLSEHLDAAYGEQSLTVAAADCNTAGNVERAVETRGPRFVFLAGPLSPQVFQQLGERIATVIHLTLEGGRPLPYPVFHETLVRRVELTSEGLASSGDVRYRPGTLRLRVGRLDRASDHLDGLDPVTRTAMGRLARSFTHRMVGVALGGGGAWGFAHVPLMKRLASMGIPIDIVSGTSAGSVTGAMFASQGLDGLDRIVRERRRVALHMASCPVSSRALGMYLARVIPERSIEDLPLPFYPVAIDIETGSERVFRRGSIADSVRASCSFPGVFGPAVFEGRRYVDGCLRNNVPAACLVDEGADFIVASNIIPPLAQRKRVYGKGLFSRVASELSLAGRVRDGVRSIFLSFHDSGERQALAADVTFTPDLSAFLATDFLKANEIIAQAELELPPVLALTSDRYKAFLARAKDVAV